jgi:uncharacterized membrane protein YtjA (UPF0391 family)
MLKAALLFLFLALGSVVLGSGHIAGLSLETGQVLTGIFAALTAISLLAGFIGRRGSSVRP